MYVSGLNKGLRKVEVTLKWDASPSGTPSNDLDIIAATYSAEDPYGKPVYLVHFDRRSPDGTITLSRDSRTGQGLGTDEAMTLELDRLADSYSRVVVGVAIQQSEGPKTFGEVQNTHVRVLDGITELMENDFSRFSGDTAATVAAFARGETGEWEFMEALRGFDADPESFAQLMGKNYP